jgi:hypothetical protein
MTPLRQLEEAKARLAAIAFQEYWNYRSLATRLESLAGMFSRTRRDQYRELMAQFHNCAGKLPYVNDCDFGALVLENAARATTNDDLRNFLITEARFRAAWCVQAAANPGETMARVSHLTRLESALAAVPG